MTHSEVEKLLGFAVPAGWQFHEIRRGGELAGFVMVLGSEVHAWRAAQFKGRWGTRQDIAAVLGPILRQYGEVTTKVRLGNTAGHRFVARLGFEKTGEQDGNALYRATRIKHARL